jgi:hypothetical protein
MTKEVIINVRVTERDREEIRDSIKLHNLNHTSKASITTIVRDAFSKFIKKNK